MFFETHLNCFTYCVTQSDKIQLLRVHFMNRYVEQQMNGINYKLSKSYVMYLDVDGIKLGSNGNHYGAPYRTFPQRYKF